MKTLVFYVIAVVSIGMAIAACNYSFATNNCEDENSPCTGAKITTWQCQMQSSNQRCCECKTVTTVCPSPPPPAWPSPDHYDRTKGDWLHHICVTTAYGKRCEVA
jgi:hypothetical protein